ncbi:MAG: MmcQ/YjbR family DNA-binding protein [Opitutales bacterium]|nr:MmcQ/YjbR family DNA-binding protein [Opitutales bacterium]
MIDDYFKDRKFSRERALAFGFKRAGDGYELKKEFEDSRFLFVARISKSGKIHAEVLDDFGEAYTLHLMDGAVGKFVGRVRDDYERTLAAIASRCFVPDAFHSGDSKKILQVVLKKYGDELEFPWDDLEAGIFRRRDSRKWYGLLMRIGRDRLGLSGEGKIEVLNLHGVPAENEKLWDEKSIFPAYHMNKKHWISILLDGGVPARKIFGLIEKSYELAKK